MNDSFKMLYAAILTCFIWQSLSAIKFLHVCGPFFCRKFDCRETLSNMALRLSSVKSKSTVFLTVRRNARKIYEKFFMMKKKSTGSKLRFSQKIG